MTLKEKFKQWFIDDDENEHYQGMVEAVAIEHEKIADDYAFEFGKWLNNKVVDPNGKHHNLAGNALVDQLLLIFKKEKGL